MKLKEYFYMLGMKPRERRYGYRVRKFNLEPFGPIEYAQWEHPADKGELVKEGSVACLRAFLRDGDFCIDIGAHGGDTTVPMALAVGKSGFVLALEPNPFVFPVLTKNASLNKDHANILPLMVAASGKDGDIELEYSDSGYCNGGLHENINKWKHGHAFKLTATGVNLSGLLRNRLPGRLPSLRYIKVDAEGYDLNILKSIDDIVEEYRPFIRAEVFKHSDKAYREAMHSFLSDKGYSVYRIENDNNYKGEELQKADMMKWKHYDIFGVPVA